MRGPPSAAEAQAYELWCDGKRTGPQIARAVGVPTWQVYQWRHSRHWPLRPKSVMSNQVRVAHRLWLQNVPAKMIALIVDVGRSTLSLWRTKYQWDKRPPGFRPGWRSPEKEAQRAAYREAIEELRTKREAQRRADAEAVLHAIEERRRVQRQTMRWRCDCGRLCQGDACPGCGGPHPLLRAA